MSGVSGRVTWSGKSVEYGSSNVAKLGFDGLDMLCPDWSGSYVVQVDTDDGQHYKVLVQGDHSNWSATELPLHLFVQIEDETVKEITVWLRGRANALRQEGSNQPHGYLYTEAAERLDREADAIERRDWRTP